MSEAYVELCPNCDDPVNEHPVDDGGAGASADSPHEDQRERARLHAHLEKCALLRKHVRRSIAVTAAILYARDCK